VGLSDEEDDFDFNERFTKLKAEFELQLKEEPELEIWEDQFSTECSTTRIKGACKLCRN